MPKLSELLEELISTYLPNISSEEFKKLLPVLWAIDKKYLAIKKENTNIKKSLEIRTRELIEKNKGLVQSTTEKEKILDNLLGMILDFDENLNSYPNKDSIKKNLKGYDLSIFLKNYITQNKKNQKVLLNKEIYLRDIVNSIWEWILVVDKLWIVKLFNVTALNITWINYTDIIGKSYINQIRFIETKTWKTYPDFIWDSIKNKKTNYISSGIEIQVNSKNIPISLVVSPLIYEDEDKNHDCVVVFKDITKDRELDNMKKEFLSIASHELRTPMTVINGYTSLLIQEKIWKINIKQKDYLSRIQKNVKYLISMVNDMLDVSKLEVGKMTFDFEKFNLHEAINDVANWLKEAYKTKNISINIKSEDLMIVSDKEKIKQVLLNLIWNAEKFTEKDGSIKIKLKINKKDKTFQVSIIDNGIWISEENIGKLFNKFSQITNHLKKTEEWTGLGLSVCKSIIEELWGNIWVKSKYWEWSEFFFILPLKWKKRSV